MVKLTGAVLHAAGVVHVAVLHCDAQRLTCVRMQALGS